MKLIENAAVEFHKLWSIRASLATAVFTATWTILASSNGLITAKTMLWFTVIVNGVVLPALRVIKQEVEDASEQK
jgi:hypothetical protein